MNRLIGISSLEGLLPEYRNTPIGLLVEYHNLGRPEEEYTTAQLLVGMCMDQRNQLRLPDNFAYVLRAGGANPRYSEFKVSYAIAVGGVKHIALIGRTQCGMVNLMARRERFVRGLVENAGWEPESAEAHFLRFAPQFEIGDEIDFALSETKRLRQRYSGVQDAPLLYRVEDHLLYAIEED